MQDGFLVGFVQGAERLKDVAVLGGQGIKQGFSGCIACYKVFNGYTQSLGYFNCIVGCGQRVVSGKVVCQCVSADFTLGCKFFYLEPLIFQF